MKQVIRTGHRNVPAFRITLEESSTGNSIVLRIEIIPKHNRSKHGRKRNSFKKNRRSSNEYKRYVARPVIGFLNITDKLKLGRRVYAHMMNNTDFEKPYPPLWVIHSVIEALDDVYYEAMDGSDEDKKVLGMKEK